jgi:hypothetical protein
MIQNGSLTFKAPSGLARGRFVTITASTDTVAYTATSAAADGVTLGAEENGVVSVQLLKDVSKSFFFEAGGTIALGDSIKVGTDGKGVAGTTPFVVAIAKTPGVSGSFATGYNK